MADQTLAYFPNMGLVSGFQSHGNHTGIHFGLGVFSFMFDVQDVRTALSHTGHELGEVARLIDQFCSQADDAPCLLHAFGNNTGKRGDVHIAA